MHPQDHHNFDFTYIGFWTNTYKIQAQDEFTAWNTIPDSASIFGVIQQGKIECRKLPDSKSNISDSHGLAALLTGSTVNWTWDLICRACVAYFLSINATISLNVRCDSLHMSFVYWLPGRKFHLMWSGPQCQSKVDEHAGITKTLMTFLKVLLAETLLPKRLLFPLPVFVKYLSD